MRIFELRYEIMMKCWEKDPSDRPTFEKLRKTLKDMERNHKVRNQGKIPGFYRAVSR